MRFATPLLLAVLASPGLTQTTTRVSVSSTGVEGNGPTTAVTISESGRWVAMQSAASNLVAGDTNGVDDIFLHDRNWATTTRISVTTGAAEANGSCALPSISGSGDRVAFESTATNLASGYGPVSQVYVHDRVAGTTVAASPVAGNGASSECAISLDGNWVVFHSSATNLVAGDTNGAADVFLCDLAGGTITRVSVSSGGTAGNGPSTKASVSSDGRYVTFVSSATNLVAGDVNGVEDVFLRDTQTGITTRVSLGSAGTEGNGGTVAGAISPDGGYVAFASDASNLVFGDTNGARDIFVKVLSSGITVRASVSSAGVQANGGSFSPGISWYGSEVSFHSLASNLVPGLDLNSARDVFKHDLDTGVTTLVSADPSGVAAAGTSWLADLDTGGRVVVFQSDAANLVAGDTNGVSDAFVQLKKTTWYIDVARTPPGTGTPGNPFTSIQYAIDRPGVVGGDDLLVAPGVYVENINLWGKSLQLKSLAGSASTVIDGGDQSSVLATSSGEGIGTLISGFLITNGAGTQVGFTGFGGGVLCIDSAINLEQCELADNSTGDSSGCGGGVYAKNAIVNLDQCVVARNTAEYGLGLYFCDTNAQVTESSISDHGNLGASQYGSGLGVMVDGTTSDVTFIDCDFDNNTPQDFSGNGGALAISTAKVKVFGCRFEDNTTGKAGGAGGRGGAIAAQDSDLEVLSSIFNWNHGDSEGGAVWASGGLVRVEGSTFSFNTSSSWGGAIALEACSADVENCYFQRNVTGFEGHDGGAIFVTGGSLTARGCEFIDNSALRGGALGAWGANSVLLEDCLFDGNSGLSQFGPLAYGGAMFVESSSVEASHCIFRNNFVTEGWTNLDGHVVYGPANLSHCTIYSDIPLQPNSGVFDATLVNCVIEGSGTPELSGNSTASYSMVLGGFPGVGNIDADPMFWDPDGGDFHLKLGSPCIDAGDPNSSLDPDGSIADMGAFPFDPDYCPSVTSYCTAGTTANGCNALISATGTPSATAASGFDVAVTGLEGQKDGIIFWGKVAQASPWGGGTSYLCIQPPVKRTGTQNSGGTSGLCDGTFSLDFNAWMQANQHKAPGVGEAVYMQAWFRDPPSPKGTSLSDGLRFVICP